MLVSFSVENWMSFKEKVTISAVASKQQKFKNHLAFIPKYNLHILPIIAIYGGNASGKSNLLGAFDFARQLIIDSPKKDVKIDVDPFILCDDSINKPSKFWFEILVENTIYEYSFSVTRDRIIEEKLTEIKSKSEVKIFERKQQDYYIKDELKDSQLTYIKKGTRENTLFLSNCIDQNNDRYQDIYNWFNNNIVLIGPTTKYGSIKCYLDETNPMYYQLNSLLRSLDTGITRLGQEEADEAHELNLKEKDDRAILRLLESIGPQRYIYTDDSNEQINKLVSFHQCEDGSEKEFDLERESDGTNRLLDILPAFVNVESKDKKFKQACFYFIDEIDRSLHHLLLKRILEHFLSTCNATSRYQIMFTTHDLLLMDQNILRKDEVYLIEKNEKGISFIIPLNEYKGIRSDKDILKSYLHGRFGGIPKL